MNGLLDECRVDSVARSSNWVWACWLNQASNLMFSSYGPAFQSIPNFAPTLISAAQACPNPVAWSNAVLTVLADDDWGEPNLVYTWSTNSTAPASVSFAPNANSEAKTSVATFGKAGSYTLMSAISDAGGLSTCSVLAVSVAQTLTRMSISPSNAVITNAYTHPFAVTAVDQFGDVMQTAPSWGVSGGGIINTSGQFTAISTGGIYAVTATVGDIIATGRIEVVSLDVGPDADLDGLADVVETGTGLFVGSNDAGTDSMAWDTDNDGLGDGAEVMIHRSDPNNPDTNAPAVWIDFPANMLQRIWTP